MLEGATGARLRRRQLDLAPEALAEARPKLQDVQTRTQVKNVRAKQDEALALERSLLGELAMNPSDQRPERIQGLTTELARTKGEYLDQVHALLARYPQFKTQFVDQQIVDPRALAKFADRLPAGTLAVQSGGQVLIRSNDLVDPMAKSLRREESHPLADEAVPAPRAAAASRTA